MDLFFVYVLYVLILQYYKAPCDSERVCVLCCVIYLLDSQLFIISIFSPLLRFLKDE